MATSKKTEVAKAENTALAFGGDQDAPDYIDKGVARGSEEVGAGDLVLPRLEIVQALSPIKENNEDAREGMLFNSVTQELIGDMAYFVPVYFRVEYLVWKDQSEGGGFRGSFPSLDLAKDRVMKAVSEGDDEDDLEIVDTPVHFGLRVTPDGHMEQIVISMAKTKAKVSRKWNAMIQLAGGDRFARVYKLSSFTDENSKGQKFKNFVVQPAGWAPKPVYEEAKRLYESFRTGVVRADHASVVPADEVAPADRGDI